MRPGLLLAVPAMAPAAMAQTAPPMWSGANLVVTGAPAGIAAAFSDFV